MTKRTLRSIAIFALLSIAPAVYAQSPGYLTSSNETGFPEYGSFIVSQIDSVNLSNGGVSIRIPLFTRKGRGLDYSFGYRYDSKAWVVDSYVVPDPWQLPILRFVWRPNNGFWSSTTNVERWVAGWTEQIYQCQPIGLPYSQYSGTVLIKSNWNVTSPDGTQYQFPVIRSYPLYPQNPCSEYDILQLKGHSGSGHIEMDITDDGGSHPFNWNVKLRAKDGSFLGSWGTPYWTKDTNGNVCCGLEDGFLTDTLGRKLGFDSGGQQLNFQVEWVNLTLSTSFPTAEPYPAHCNFNQSGNIGMNSIKKITLPNGLSYEFFYETWWDTGNPTAQNPYGEVTKVRLPTGGYIKYKWATIAQMDEGPEGAPNFIDCTPLLDARVLVERRVSEDGASEQVWQYSYDTQAGTTTVTDPVGNVEIHWFTNDKIRLEWRVEYRQGPSTPLRRVETNWASDTGPIFARQYSPGQEAFGLTGIFDLGPRNYRTIRQTTTLLDTNQVSKTETDYDCFNYSIIGGSFTDCRDNPTQVREYNWGTGSPGALARYTTLAYLHNVNSTCSNAHIWDRVTDKMVFDGSGGLKAWAQFGYDTTTITATSGVPLHDYSSHPSTYTVRGNRTLAKSWRNTDGAWLTTTNYFNDTGNLIQTTDPGGHTTTFSYTDNYSDGVNRNSQGYVTQVTYPTTNGVSHIERKQYFWYTGLTAAQCGQNFSGACTNTPTPPQADYAKFTYDMFGRPLTVVRGDGGQTTIAYTEPATPTPGAPITLSSTTTISAGQNLVNSAVIDGLGRVKQTQLNSNPGCAIKVDAAYDALGRKSTVSNPYCTTGEPTYGITKFKYDALGRATRVIPPDGNEAGDTNVVKTDYSGNTVTVTDQAGKQRRSYTDGLGRLITVHEPGNSQTVPSQAAPGTGWVQITGTEQSYQDQQWVEECELYDETGYCIQWGGHWEYTTYWDTGGVSVTVNGLTKSTTYGQSSTAAALATALGSAINADSGYPVTAAVNGTTITLTAKTNGAATNYTLSATSSTNDPGHFASPSFIPVRSGPALTGGSDYSPGNPGSGPLLLSTPAVTSYTYDTLDNLTQVVQSGSRPRTFTYNSLSQLTQAVNPESGTINYTYDNDGNLLTKVAPAPNQTGSATVTTTFTYDTLHRLTQKGYSDSTPVVKYAYDGTAPVGCSPTLTITNGVGRRTAMCDGAGWEAWAYNAMGQVVTDRRNTNSVAKDLTYGYNPAGGVTSVAYPTNRTITYAYNTAAQPVSAIDVVNGINYATGALYSAGGGLASLTNGASLVSTYFYNNRLQPCRISVKFSGTAPGNCPDTTNIGNVLDFSYGFSLGTANNGNVASIANNRVSARSQSFTYDELNRIKTAQTQATTGSYCWGEAFGYDIWANLLTIGGLTGYTGCTQENLNIGVTTKNQISGYTYDAAGNMTTNPGVGTYTYDAENRITATAGVTYTYDGDGKRVKKSNGKLYWYGMSADAMLETDAAGNTPMEFIFFGGKRIARRDSGGAVSYFFADHLGTSRVVTNATGGAPEESDFYPFGGERVVTDTLSNQNYKFTGKERDAESGLDFFIARHYASNLGRFLQPDEFTGGPVDAFSSNDPAPDSPLPYAVISNPQSLNKYTYTWNNPQRHTDPDGHFLDTIVDAVSVGYGIASVVASAVTGSDQLGTDLKALGADVVGLVVPGVTGLGNAVRAGKVAENAVDAIKATDKAGDAAKLGSKADEAGGAASSFAKRGAEPPQLARGKQAHKAEPVRPGERAEVTTPSRKGRMDRYDAGKAHIRELKPDNKRGHTSGQKALTRYKKEMDSATGKNHSTELATYKP
jgi:RHS repeat-associated protein